MLDLAKLMTLPPAGHYVVAVSGGVDSMSLLYILSHLAKPWRFTVAHVNHGMRKEAAMDEALVGQACRGLGLDYESLSLALGEASEDAARRGRYYFLESVRQRSGAIGIMTAHHADDRLETAYLNTMRGCGARGLVALRSHGLIARPFINISKQQLLDFAARRHLEWREDETNRDIRIMRNAVRHQLLPVLRLAERRHLARGLNALEQLTDRIDCQLDGLIKVEFNQAAVGRRSARTLSAPAARELVIRMIRRLDPAAEISARAIAAVGLAIQTGRTGQKQLINGDLSMLITKSDILIKLTTRQRSLPAEITAKLAVATGKTGRAGGY